MYDYESSAKTPKKMSPWLGGFDNLRRAYIHAPEDMCVILTVEFISKIIFGLEILSIYLV